MTIWGQSAGARSVVALYQSPMAAGLFQSAIAMSPGYIPAMFQANLSSVVSSMSRRCLEITKCQTLDCLETMDIQQLVKSCIFYLTPEELPGASKRVKDGLSMGLKRLKEA